MEKKCLLIVGVQTAVTEFSTGKVIVTGTMDANKLVDYVYRRTKKQAKIVPQPEPEPEPENKEAVEEAKPEEKKEEGGEKEKDGEDSNQNYEMELNHNFDEEESMKRMMYYYQPLYVIERMPPPPQLFSDENPNACCIS